MSNRKLNVNGNSRRMWSILRNFPGMWHYVLTKIKTNPLSHGLWSNCGPDIWLVYANYLSLYSVNFLKAGQIQYGGIHQNSCRV